MNNKETCFADTPRVKNKPFRKRVGDNMLERDKNGHVCNWFGYYSASQVLARERFSKTIYDSMIKEMYTY